MLWHWIFHLKPTGIIGVATELIITSGIHNLHCKTRARVNLTTDGMKSFVIKHGLLRLVFTVQNVSSTAFPRWIPKQRNVWFGLFHRVNEATRPQLCVSRTEIFIKYLCRAFGALCDFAYDKAMLEASTQWQLDGFMGIFFLQANVADKRRENHNSDKMQTSFLVTYLREVCRRNRSLNTSPAFARLL